MQDLEEPEEVRLRRVVPDIASRLNVNRQDIVRTVADHGQRNTQLLQQLSRQFDDLLGGRITLRFAPLDTLAPYRTNTTEAVSAEASDDVATLQVAATALAAAPLAPAATPPSYDPDSPPPAYRISRTIVTVHDLWRE